MTATQRIPVTEKEKVLIAAAISELQVALSHLEEAMARIEPPSDRMQRRH